MKTVLVYGFLLNFAYDMQKHFRGKEKIFNSL